MTSGDVAPGQSRHPECHSHGCSRQPGKTPVRPGCFSPAAPTIPSADRCIVPARRVSCPARQRPRTPEPHHIPGVALAIVAQCRRLEDSGHPYRRQRCRQFLVVTHRVKGRRRQPAVTNKGLLPNPILGIFRSGGTGTYQPQLASRRRKASTGTFSIRVVGYSVTMPCRIRRGFRVGVFALQMLIGECARRGFIGSGSITMTL